MLFSTKTVSSIAMAVLATKALAAPQVGSSSSSTSSPSSGDGESFQLVAVPTANSSEQFQTMFQTPSLSLRRWFNQTETPEPFLSLASFDAGDVADVSFQLQSGKLVVLDQDRSYEVKLSGENVYQMERQDVILVAPGQGNGTSNMAFSSDNTLINTDNPNAAWRFVPGLMGWPLYWNQPALPDQLSLDVLIKKA